MKWLKCVLKRVMDTSEKHFPLTAMCVGWNGCDMINPGFLKDGKWNVKWEGLCLLLKC